MRLRVESLRYGVEEEPADIAHLLVERLGLAIDSIKDIRILRKSLDARRRRHFWVVTLEVTVEGVSSTAEQRIIKRDGVRLISEAAATERRIPKWRQDKKVVIVGCGPAGIFAALALTKRGMKPEIIERGRQVEQRIADVEGFWKRGVLRDDSNVQFGEGGAGTFSDGKLTTRIKDQRKEQVLQELIEAGASREIAYLNRPHLGTDRLVPIIRRLREHLEARGAEIRFEERLIDIVEEKGRLRGVVTTRGTMEVDHLFLAIGHSARETYEMLQRKGVAMTSKPFAVGLRIEHPQRLVDLSRYGRSATHPRLGAAEYFFTYKDSVSGRGVYTFCMCPGGYVVAGSSERETVTTNGMSRALRNSEYGNSAVVVTVGQKDFGSDHPLAGLFFQRRLEEDAYLMGGGGYVAPVQKAGDFLEGAISEETPYCTYLPGVRNADLRKLLPTFLLGPLQAGLLHFASKMKGFIRQGVLVGVETRTSSPVRILRRDTNCHSISLPGLIPVGEGAGYSGGIVSSAVDGIRAAEQFHLEP